MSNLDIQGSFWVLEGGYNPLVLGPCVLATLEGLQGNPLPNLEDHEERDEDEEETNNNKKFMKKILKIFSPFF